MSSWFELREYYGEELDGDGGSWVPGAAPAFSYPVSPVVWGEQASHTATPVHTGGEPDTFIVDSGSLPAGMGLDANTGVIGGKTTATGSGSAVIKATNGVGSGTAEFVWLVAADGAIIIEGKNSEGVGYAEVAFNVIY